MFITDIIETIITNIDNSLSVSGISGNDLICHDVKYSGLFNNIIETVGGTSTLIPITKVDKDTGRITLSSAPNPAAKYSLLPPFFLAGTRYATNREWTEASDREEDKLPLIWMHFNPFPTEVVERNTANAFISEWENINIFFLDNYDSLNWITKDNIENKIEPLRALAKAFIESAESARCNCRLSDRVTFKHYPVFGTENANGINSKILNADLSAVHINFNLKIKK